MMTSRPVARLLKAAGTQQFVWNGRDTSSRQLGSGVYLVRISDGQTVTMKKVVLAK